MARSRRSSPRRGSASRGSFTSSPGRTTFRAGASSRPPPSRTAKARAIFRIELLKAYFVIQDKDDSLAIRNKVIGKLLALDGSLKPTVPALLALLDVPVDDAAWRSLDPAQRRQRT